MELHGTSLELRCCSRVLSKTLAERHWNFMERLWNLDVADMCCRKPWRNVQELHGTSCLQTCFVENHCGTQMERNGTSLELRWCKRKVSENLGGTSLERTWNVIGTQTVKSL